MAKQKKNANYQTEKTIAEKARLEEEQQKKEQTEKIKIIAIVSSVVAAIVALIVGFMFAVGLFNYRPEVTGHASMSLGDYGSFHVELYGNDAPDAVAKLLELGDKNYFTGKKLHTLKDGMLYGGDEAINGAIENKKNSVMLEKGVICAKMGKDGNKTTYQFYIITDNNAKVDDSYIAIGKIDDLGVLDKILADVETDANGKISDETAPTISSLSDHAAH